MNHRHLRYFVAVAEELHFTRAAERLNMAQPPLSLQIKQLEDDLDTVLIERGSRPMRLTRAGEALLDHARRLLEMNTAARADVIRIGKGQTGQLNVGFVGSALFSVLPGILSEFREQFPKVDLSLNEMLAGQIAIGLQQQTIDVGIVRPALTDLDAIEQKPLLEEPLVLAVPQAHPLAGKAQVPLSSVQHERLILYPRHPKPSLTDTILEALRTTGVEPDIVQDVLHLQTALILVAQGIGLTFVARSVARQTRTGVAFVEIGDACPKTILSAAWRKDVSSPSLKNFLDVCAQQSQKYLHNETP